LALVELGDLTRKYICLPKEEEETGEGFLFFSLWVCGLFGS
jgi:hypothetical protein